MNSSLLIKTFIFFLFITSTSIPESAEKKNFQGKAYYFSKSTMNLGNWGARMSEAQKKQIMSRLKGRLEKSYILTFNKEESLYYEEEKLDAISGATDSWGKNFTEGKKYKNVKSANLTQNQEFYGKKFLIKDKLQNINWKIGSETKQIGNYTCLKATALIPEEDLTWYSFSWSKIRNNSASNLTKDKNQEIKMIKVEAWYTPQIPINNGPSSYWGLPGLILEVNTGNTTFLCYKIVMNPEDKIKIKALEKGKIVTKKEYQEIIVTKMKEFRDIRTSRRRR